MAKKTAKKAAKPVKAKTSVKAHKAAKPEKQILPLTKVTASSNPRTKSEILGLLAETTGLSKRDVSNVFSSLTHLISTDVGKKGCGVFTVPGLMKIRRISKPATKARKGINPFTGEETTFKAKPARNIVKVRPMKALKDMV